MFPFKNELCFPSFDAYFLTFSVDPSMLKDGSISGEAIVFRAYFQISLALCPFFAIRGWHELVATDSLFGSTAAFFIHGRPKPSQSPPPPFYACPLMMFRFLSSQPPCLPPAFWSHTSHTRLSSSSLRFFPMAVSSCGGPHSG